MSLQSILAMKKDSNGQHSSAKRDDLLPTIDRHYNHLLDLPKRIGLGCERVKLTPELAQHYLTFNRTNRRIKLRTIKRYTEAIRRGEFKETGDTIKFTKGGKMADGQNRCHAVVEAGLPIFVFVVYGLDDDVFPYLDQGDPRKHKDTLSRHGLSDWECGVAGTAINALINHSKGSPLWSALKRENRDVESFFLEFPALAKSLRFISELPRKLTPIPHSRALVLHYLFAAKDVPAADEFIAKLFSGDSIGRSSPIYHLREKLLASQLAGEPYGAREQLHACVKAWNHVRARHQLSSSRGLFPRSDETMPEIE